VSASAGADEYRVELDLDDPEHGFSFRERLRALDVDDEARKRLGRNAVVTRDGPHVFVYTETEEQAREAERILREIAAAEGVSGEVRVSRWHDMAERWEDASVPMPESEDELDEEYGRREDAAAREVEEEGEYDWHVVAHAPDRKAAAELARRLESLDIPVARRWRYVVAGALTEEHALELADRIRAEAPPETEVSVEVNLSDIGPPTFLFLPA
jgi:hypothetical protein